MTKKVLLTSVVLIVGFPAILFSQGQETSERSVLTVEGQLCTGIEERMPVGASESFDAEVGKVYLWCKITGAAGTTAVKHVWSYEGKEMAVVELPVKSPAWRTWSCKTILPEWTGMWEVKVLDAEGEVLKAVSFTVGASKTVKPMETTEPTDTVAPIDTSENKEP